MKRFLSARWVLVMAMVASLMAFTPTNAAVAAESIPELQWPVITAGNGSYQPGQITSPTGSVTLPCTGNANLRTWNASGQLIQDISRTSQIDGVNNCIQTPVVDKNGHVYGVPFGPSSFGVNLLAYNGNTLEWKYPVSCGSAGSQAAVGADGNIYVTTYGHLIGLKPELDAGQTQPTVVVDITIPTDCSAMIYPFKDGIMLHGQRSGGVHFYSYSGKEIRVTPGQLWSEQINAAGRLFTYTTVSGSYTSISVSAYDPFKGTKAWTTSVSTRGANTNGGPNLHPLPGGGVAVLITEQKMISGVPASPTQWVKTLAVLNDAGQKIRSITLPDEDAQGNAFTSELNIVADSSGKLVVVRGLNIVTGMSYPYTVPAISIGLYDPVGNTWTYQQVMKGDLNKSGGPNGYALNYAANGVSLAGDTVFFTAKCTNNCNDYNHKLYAIKIPGLGLDYPRGAVLTANMPQQPAAVSYVGLGDSYSSSWGAGKYEDGTATSTNTCRRSARAYAHVLHGDPYSPLRLDKFIACGGATAPRITSTWPNTGDKLNLNEPTQLSAVTSSTRVVTLTMGGNDVGFADVIKGCAINCSRAVTTATNSINTTLAPALTKAYKAILSKSTKADVYVLGYPPMLSASATLCASSAPFNSTTKRKLGIDLLNQLNAKIRATVAAVGSPRIHYLDPTAAGSPFIGHDICSRNPYVYGLNATEIPAGLFHPSINGEIAYAKMVTTYLIAHPLR